MKKIWEQLPMSSRYTIMFCIGFTVSALAILPSCDKIPHDSPIEEMTEELIKQKTGLDLDLTPGSKEKPCV